MLYKRIALTDDPPKDNYKLRLLIISLILSAVSLMSLFLISFTHELDTEVILSGDDGQNALADESDQYSEASLPVASKQPSVKEPLIAINESISTPLPVINDTETLAITNKITEPDHQKEIIPEPKVLPQKPVELADLPANIIPPIDSIATNIKVDPVKVAEIVSDQVSRIPNPIADTSASTDKGNDSKDSKSGTEGIDNGTGAIVGNTVRQPLSGFGNVTIFYSTSDGRQLIAVPRLSISSSDCAGAKTGSTITLSLTYNIENDGHISKIELVRGSGYSLVDQKLISSLVSYRFSEQSSVTQGTITFAIKLTH